MSRLSLASLLMLLWVIQSSLDNFWPTKKTMLALNNFFLFSSSEEDNGDGQLSRNVVRIKYRDSELKNTRRHQNEDLQIFRQIGGVQGEMFKS
jgi:hypothetical protein